MKLVVETGTFADAVQAASKFANPKEPLYSGVMVQWRSTTVDEGFMVQASNGDVTFRRIVRPEEVTFDENDRRQLYFPAKLAAKLLPKFPLGADSFLEIETDGKEADLRCGKLRVKLNLLDPETFPHIPIYGTDSLGVVAGLAQRLKQVSFAADKEGIKSGLHLDGQHIICVSTGLLARADCMVPVEAPVTLPIRMLSGILRNTDEILVGERDGRFILQTDQDTQVITTVMLDPYPNTAPFQDIRAKYCTGRFGFAKTTMRDALLRMMALCADEQAPRFRMWVRESQLDLQIRVDEVGEISDSMEAWSETPSELRYAVTPSYLLDICQVWPTANLDAEYCPDSNLRPFAAEHKGLMIMWMPFRDLTP